MSFSQSGPSIVNSTGKPREALKPVSERSCPNTSVSGRSFLRSPRTCSMISLLGELALLGVLQDDVDRAGVHDVVLLVVADRGVQVFDVLAGL